MRRADYDRSELRPKRPAAADFSSPHPCFPGKAERFSYRLLQVASRRTGRLKKEKMVLL
jgi:hypothetical protein